MRMTASDNIVAEQDAWAATEGDVFGLPQLRVLGLAISRGHIDRSEISQRVDPVFGSGQWSLYATPTHEWWLPTLHTQDCWSERYEGMEPDPDFEPCGLTSGGCDSRAYIDISEPHIVWRPATQTTTGAVPVTVLEINPDPDDEPEPEPDQVIPGQTALAT